MSGEELTLSIGQLLEGILNRFDDEANASYLTMGHDELLASIVNVVDDGAGASHLTMSQNDLWAAIANAIGSVSIYSDSIQSDDELMAAIWNGLNEDADASHQNFTYLELLAGIYVASETGLGPTIQLSASTVDEDAEVGAAVGTASISGDVTGTAEWSLTDSASGKFAINSSTGAVTVADVLTPGQFNITIAVTGVSPAPPPRTFVITVTEVSEAAGDSLLLFDSGGVTFLHLGMI